MSRFAVVYHSATGTTEALASAIAAGIHSVGGAEATMLKIEGADIDRGRYINSEMMRQLDACDGIIFGSPTFMGSVSTQFKAFMDATSERYSKRTWSGKLAAGFTIGSSPSGDQLNTIQTLHIFASQHGMMWISIDLPAGFRPGLNDQGAQSGLIAHAENGAVRKPDLQIAEYLGARLARMALRFSCTLNM